MQSQVAERDHRDETSNAVPVHGYACASLDVFGGLAGALELQQSATRGRGWSSTGLDVFETFLNGSLEFMSVDLARLQPRGAWGRPGDELLAAEQNGQAKFGFEAIDSSPVDGKNPEWVSNDDFGFVELDSWFNEEQPNGQIKEGQHADQAGKTFRLTGYECRNNGAQCNCSGTDNCVTSETWSNDVHSAYYPSETNGSHEMCEETK